MPETWASNAVYSVFEAGTLGAATSMIEADDSGQDYVVRDGDTLGKIATRFYEDPLAYPTIIAGNNAKAGWDSSYDVIHTPDEIHPGQKLWIPVVETTEASEEEVGTEHEVAHWEYQGESGPTHWGGLQDHFCLLRNRS